MVMVESNPLDPPPHLAQPWSLHSAILMHLGSAEVHISSTSSRVELYLHYIFFTFQSLSLQ